MTRKLWVALAAVTVAVAAYAGAWLFYPSDRTPEGAYLRVVSAVNRGEPKAFFAYIETDAQHACFTIGEYRKRSIEVVGAHFPPAQRDRALSQLGPAATVHDGPDVFAAYATQRKWFDALRQDMSGVEKVEVQGERATVQTVRGTRYPFRRRDNGIWGLTLFTAELVDEATRAARDFALHESAAQDFRRAGGG